MERNVMGELNVYRQLGIKPNFTQIGRRYGLHRQTVAKYWRRGEEVEDRRRDKESAFDEFRDVMESKAAMPGVTKKATSSCSTGTLMWLMWLYLIGHIDESLRAIRGGEAPCGIRSTPGGSPRSSGGR